MGKQQKSSIELHLKDDHLPFSSYRAGSISKQGKKIEKIFFYGKNYIVYRCEGNTVGIETYNLDARLEPAIAEYKRLAGAVAKHFDGNFLSEINGLLLNALSSAMSSKESENPLDYFKMPGDFISEKGNIEKIYGSGKDFVVYLNKRGKVDWVFSRRKSIVESALNKIKRIGIVSPVGLSKIYIEHINNIISNAVIVLLKGDNQKDPEEYVNALEKIIDDRKNSLQRTKFLIFTLSSSVALSFVLILILLFITPGFGSAFDVLIGALGGVVGATVSLIQRSNSIEFDSFTPPLHFSILCFIRVFLGLVFGIFIVLIVKADLLLGVLRDNSFSLFVVAFIAGLIERKVPNIFSGNSQ